MNYCTSTAKGCLSFCYNIVALVHTELTVNWNTEVSSGCSNCHRVPNLPFSQFSGDASTRLYMYIYLVTCWHSCNQANVPNRLLPFRFLMKFYNHSPWFQVQVFMTLFVLMQSILHLILINYQQEVTVEFNLHMELFSFRKRQMGSSISLLPSPLFQFSLCHQNKQTNKKHFSPLQIAPNTSWLFYFQLLLRLFVFYF